MVYGIIGGIGCKILLNGELLSQLVLLGSVQLRILIYHQSILRDSDWELDVIPSPCLLGFELVLRVVFVVVGFGLIMDYFEKS